MTEFNKYFRGLCMNLPEIKTDFLRFIQFNQRKSVFIDTLYTIPGTAVNFYGSFVSSGFSVSSPVTSFRSFTKVS
jgi:hypothetical protein